MAHGSPGAEDHNANPRDNGRGIPDVVDTLTHRLTDLGRRMDGSDRTGLGIVTLAGSNKGAVMKAEHLDEEESSMERFGGGRLGAYTNSNYQAVNNSILVDGKCEAEDPGVHIEIVDCIEGREGEDDEDKEKEKKKKKEKKEKKKESNSEGKEEKGSGSE